MRPKFALFSLKKPTTKIDANRGQVSANGENVYFMDNVRVVRAATQSKGEMTVVTDYLHIVPKQDFVQTDRPVTILQAPHTVIHAGGMEFYKKLGVVNLQHRVKVHYQKPDAEFLKTLTIEQVTGKPVAVGKKSVVEGLGEPVIVAPSVKEKGVKEKVPPAKPVKAKKPKKSAPIKQANTVKKERVRRHYEKISN